MSRNTSVSNPRRKTPAKSSNYKTNRHTNRCRNKFQGTSTQALKGLPSVVLLKSVIMQNDHGQSRLTKKNNVRRSKVFDSMCHEILIEILKCMKFGDKAISMIKLYLQNRIQMVILRSCSSDWIKLYQGVPQGTIMGPLLFNIYVNFMRSSVQRPTQLAQYADDTFLYSARGNLEQPMK